jgi:hypothetical protein
MDLFQSLVVARLILFLGILNFVLISLVYLSCRCLPPSKMGNRLMKIGWYKRLFAKHCYLWPVLWTSVVIHAFLAIMFIGWPK